MQGVGFYGIKYVQPVRTINISLKPFFNTLLQRDLSYNK